MATLKVCMNLSANPLVEGWYKDTNVFDPVELAEASKFS